MISTPILSYMGGVCATVAAVLVIPAAHAFFATASFASLVGLSLFMASGATAAWLIDRESNG